MTKITLLHEFIPLSVCPTESSETELMMDNKKHVDIFMIELKNYE